MKFTINRKKLLEALGVGGALAGKAKTVPILEQVLIRVVDNTLTVVSSNSESQVLKRVEVMESEGNLDFCTDPDDLVKALKTLATDYVSIDASTDGIKVIHSKGCIEFPACSAVPFPIMPKSKNVKSVTLPSALMKDWILIGRNFVSNDTFKPVMNGMYMVIEGNTIAVCATDACKLFTDSTDYDNTTNESLSVIIPASVFPMIINILNECEQVKMSLDEKNVSFNSTSAKVTTRIIEGAYPNYKAVIPNNNDIEISVNKNEIKQAIARAGLFSNKATGLVKLSINGDKMGITGQDINFAKKSYEEIDITHSGNDAAIGVKAEYADICLNTISDEQVTILLSNPSRPLLFKDKSFPNMTILQMPMVLSE